MKYQQEFMDTCLESMIPLFDKHWEEIALHKDTIKLNPDYDKYRQAEEEGKLKVFTVRDGDVLCGYIVFFCDYHIHYKDNVWAIMDILYIDPEYRNSGVGVELITFAESCLKSDGIDVVMINTKSHKSFGDLLERIGYFEVETFYGKRV